MGFLKHIQEVVKQDFLSPMGHFFLGWILIYAIVGVTLNFRAQRKRGAGRLSLKAALKFSFPRMSYLGASARVDYAMIILDSYLFSWLLGFFYFDDPGKVASLVSPHVFKALAFLGSSHLSLTNGFWVDADLGLTLAHSHFPPSGTVALGVS